MSKTFENYQIIEVRDKRDESMPEDCSRFEYAVVGHAPITVTDSGWQLPDQKVLFTTDLCCYDGGYQACEAFIEGYKSALPMRITNYSVSSGGIDMTVVDSPEGHAGKG